MGVSTCAAEEADEWRRRRPRADTTMLPAPRLRSLHIPLLLLLLLLAPLVAGYGGSSIEAQIRALYREHNPAKLSDVPSLLTKYRGAEAELLRSIRTKYGVDERGREPERDDEPEEGAEVDYAQKLVDFRSGGVDEAGLQAVAEEITCDVCRFVVEDTWSEVVGAIANKGERFSGGAREARESLERLCTIPSTKLERYLALFSINECPDPAAAPKLDVRALKKKLPAAQIHEEGVPAACEEEGRRWWVERDTPWTADSMAQLRELRGLRLKELQRRARAAGVTEESLEEAMDNDDPTDDDAATKDAVIALLLENEPDPFLANTAAKYEGAVVSRMADESRHWQLKVYMKLCADVLEPRDVELSDAVAGQVSRMGEHLERIQSPARYDPAESAWAMTRDGRAEVAEAACEEICEEAAGQKNRKGKKKKKGKGKGKKKGTKGAGKRASADTVDDRDL